MAHNYGKSFNKHGDFIQAISKTLLPPLIHDMAIGPNENLLQHEVRDGTLTKEYLAPALSDEKGRGKIFGLEKSSTMKEIAMEHSEHEKIIYLNKDLVDTDLELCFKGEKIHKIFSLYVLMCAEDYRASLLKMNTILESKGKICLVFATRMDFYFRYIKKLKEDPEWGPYVREMSIPDWVEADWRGEAYLDVIRDAVAAAGFTIAKLELENHSQTFDTKAEFAGNTFITLNSIFRLRI
jgi:hypothetical protein